MRIIVLCLVLAGCGSSKPGAEGGGEAAAQELPSECTRYLELMRTCASEISPEARVETDEKLALIEPQMRKKLADGSTSPEKAAFGCTQATKAAQGELGPSCPSVTWP